MLKWLCVCVFVVIVLCVADGGWENLRCWLIDRIKTKDPAGLVNVTLSGVIEGLEPERVEFKVHFGEPSSPSTDTYSTPASDCRPRKGKKKSDTLLYIFP